MIHIDNLDGEGTIFMSTDDGTQSIGHVEKEYASILQDVLKSYDWYVKEVKRLRKLEAAVVGSWMETINRGSSWHKQLRDPCVDLGYLELRDVEHISRIGNRYTSKHFCLKEEYEEMAKQWIKEEYGVEEE